ncbi:MAG: Sec-independent protein translocase protein TatB [Pseudomonadota bacterium]
MFDLGFAELLVIGVVALIVVGPKDLPGMFRTLGRFTGKLRGMAREFQRAMNEAADSSGVGDVAKDLKKATSSKGLGLDKLNKAAESFEKWDPVKAASGRASGAPGEGLSEERAAAAKKIHEATAAKEAAKAAAAAEPEVAAEADAPPAEAKPAGESTT